MRISPFSFARDRSLRFAPWCGLACDTTKGCSARGRGGLGKVMRGAGRLSCRWGLLTVLSLGLHAAITAWLAGSTAPVLRDDGPDLPLMTIELTPPDAESPQAKVSRRAFVVSASVSSPVPGAPTLSAAPGDVAPAAPALTASPGVAPPSDALRAALRAGGCLRGASLSREERERCEERLGRLQAATPSYPAAMDPAKRAYYDAVVAADPSGGGYGDTTPGAVSPGAAYGRFINCSIKFGPGAKPKDRQGEIRLGATPCVVPIQGNFFVPEASVRKR